MTQPVRTATARLRADTGQYKRELRDARAVTGDLAKEMSRLGALATQKAAEQAKAAHTAEQAYQRQLGAADRLGRTMVVAGAGIAAGIGLATRAAINWESAWAGVAKTVDGSADELAALEGELRELATELPATHGEIAAVAEAAGQLGVATEDITAFTETMIALGESTNLTADEAATAIAQLMNVMGTAPTEVGNLGSALVELGNNGASTERQIIMMAQRIAGAGAIVGATESEVLALANALSSAGIEVEAGGSAISRVLVSMAQAVAEGSDMLEGFAQVAGTSAEDFAQQFGTDPVAALNLFVQGLGRMNTAGEDVFGTLDQLELSEIRTRDALLRLAASGDLLTESLMDGERAWGENVALTEEAQRRYQTAAAQIQIARNQLNEFAIEMGATFLPVVADTAGAVGSFAEFLADLPDPLQRTLGVVAALTAGILVMGGTAMMAVPRIAAYQAAIASINAAGGTTATVVGRLNSGMRMTAVWAGRAIGVFAALQLAAVGVEAVFGNDLNPQIDALGVGLRRLASDGEVAGEAARVLGEDLEGIALAMRLVGPEGLGPNIGNALKSFFSPTEWADAEGSLQGAKEQIEALDAAMAQLVQGGHQEAAAEVFRRLTEIANENGVSTERLTELLPGYAAALEVATQQGGEAATGITEVGDAATQAAVHIDELRGAFEELFGIQMDADRALIAYREGLVALEEELDRGAESLSVNSDAGRANRSAVLDQIDAIANLRNANIENGMGIAEANRKYDEQLDVIEEMLVERGFEKDAVRDLIRAYRNIPDQVSTTVTTPGLSAAEQALQRIRDKVGAIPRYVEVHVRAIQSGRPLPVGGIQHGGEVPGRYQGRPDTEVFALTPGEIVIRRAVAQPNRDMLLAWNRTGQLPGGTLLQPRHRDASAIGVGGRFQWRGARVAGDGAAAVAPAVDQAALAHLVAREVGRAIDGATLVVDDRGMGRLEARQADFYRRGG